ncbi:hypothetical protein V1511DRAFT_495561 [Dipodascopsis uninucleata]
MSAVIVPTNETLTQSPELVTTEIEDYNMDYNDRSDIDIAPGEDDQDEKMLLDEDQLNATIFSGEETSPVYPDYISEAESSDSDQNDEVKVFGISESVSPSYREISLDTTASYIVEEPTDASTNENSIADSIDLTELRSNTDNDTQGDKLVLEVKVDELHEESIITSEHAEREEFSHYQVDESEIYVNSNNQNDDEASVLEYYSENDSEGSASAVHGDNVIVVTEIEEETIQENPIIISQGNSQLSGNVNISRSSDTYNSPDEKSLEEINERIVAKEDSKASKNVQTQEEKTGDPAATHEIQIVTIEDSDNGSNEGNTEACNIRLDFPKVCVLLEYLENYFVLAPSDNMSRFKIYEATDLLRNYEILSRPLEGLFTVLREYFADAITPESELMLDIPKLKLSVSEDNIYSHEVTVYDLVDLYSGLSMNDQRDVSSEALIIRLLTRPRFISRFNYISHIIQLGNGLHDLEAHVSDNTEENEVTGSDGPKNEVNNVQSVENIEEVNKLAAKDDEGDEEDLITTEYDDLYQNDILAPGDNAKETETVVNAQAHETLRDALEISTQGRDPLLEDQGLVIDENNEPQGSIVSTKRTLDSFDKERNIDGPESKRSKSNLKTEA